MSRKIAPMSSEEAKIIKQQKIIELCELQEQMFAMCADAVALIEQYQNEYNAAKIKFDDLRRETGIQITLPVFGIDSNGNSIERTINGADEWNSSSQHC